MWRNRWQLHHFPGARAVAVRLVVQSADRAQVNNVCRQLVINGLFKVHADLHVLATADCSQFLQTLDFLAEANAARAMDAAGHIRGNQRAEVLVLDDALAIVIARHITTVAHRQVLQFALTTLVADRAIQRMIDQQKFHRRFLRRNRFRRTREHFHAVAHRRGASRQRLRCFLNLDEAHAAIRGDAQFFVVTEARDVTARGVRYFNEHLALAAFDRLAVNFNRYSIVAHAATPVLLSTMLRP